MTMVDPRDAVEALAACREPYLLGVRHHSPALAAMVPALLDAAGAEVLCVELPAEFQSWWEYVADPETVAPVALAARGGTGAWRSTRSPTSPRTGGDPLGAGARRRGGLL